MKKMKENKAGNYIPRKIANEIIDVILKRDDVDDSFVDGAATVLAYLTCPEDKPMNGAEIGKFVDNALYRLDRCDDMANVMSQAQKVIDELKAAGINVVEAFIMKEGN